MCVLRPHVYVVRSSMGTNSCWRAALNEVGWPLDDNSAVVAGPRDATDADSDRGREGECEREVARQGQRGGHVDSWCTTGHSHACSGLGYVSAMSTSAGDRPERARRRSQQQRLPHRHLSRRLAAAGCRQKLAYAGAVVGGQQQRAAQEAACAGSAAGGPKQRAAEEAAAAAADGGANLGGHCPAAGTS